MYSYIRPWYTPDIVVVKTPCIPHNAEPITLIKPNLYTNIRKVRAWLKKQKGPLKP